MDLDEKGLRDRIFFGGGIDLPNMRLILSYLVQLKVRAFYEMTINEVVAINPGLNHSLLF